MPQTKWRVPSWTPLLFNLGAEKRMMLAEARYLLEAELDVEVLPRVIGQFARRGLILNRMEVSHTDCTMHIKVAVGPIDEWAAEVIRAKLQALIGIQSAVLG